MRVKIAFFSLILIICLSYNHDIFGQQTDGNRPKVGIVLSGGAAKGLAHIGVLKVIEEVGLPVDFIAGTSMGAVIGGLYAIGYDAENLEKLTLEQDWDKLLGDNIYRQDLSIEEKNEEDLFFISFPFGESGFSLPPGLISGQNIENKLNKLCAHVYHIRDFNDFNIPFLCVATDIITGKEVAIRSGYLPRAIRASISIPSIFEPARFNDQLLVDGGVLNNFPADYMNRMGADIIIGVNVGYQMPERKELNNLFKIFEQTVFLMSREKENHNKALCDVLISPNLTGLNLSDFSMADTIIRRGEKAARSMMTVLQALADSLNEMYHLQPTKPSFEPLDSVFIKEINIHGLRKVSVKLLTGILHLEENSKATPEEIYNAINHAYSSLYFEKITYELQNMNEGSTEKEVQLIINVREREGVLVRVGINYNTDFKSSIILNATFRNLLLDGSKLSVNFGLGENPRFLASYFKNNGWKPGFGLDLDIKNFNIFRFEGSRKVATLDYTDYSSRFYIQSIFSNSYSLGTGLEYERVILKPIISETIEETQSTDFYNAYGFIHLDTYDDISYPTKGSRFIALYKLINNQSIAPVHFLTFRYDQAIGSGKHLTFIPGIYGGISTADSSTSIYHFYLGGLNQFYRKGLIPFPGLEFMQVTNRCVAGTGINIQYNLWKKNYVALCFRAASTSWNLYNLLEKNSGIYGFGLTFGNNSIIGPIEVTFMGSNLHRDLFTYFNIGYWF
jgi:NTE family protein